MSMLVWIVKHIIKNNNNNNSSEKFWYKENANFKIHLEGLNILLKYETDGSNLVEVTFLFPSENKSSIFWVVCKQYCMGLLTLNCYITRMIKSHFKIGHCYTTDVDNVLVNERR